MYKRILLTLDTSEFAERAIPHAVELAKAFNARLCALSVVPVIDAETTGDQPLGIDWDREVAHTEEYLTGICKALACEGLELDIEIRRGNVTEEILLYSDKYEADLIVMSTHGRSGLGRWVYGSVTDRVLRYADVPVLLVRAAEEPHEED